MPALALYFLAAEQSEVGLVNQRVGWSVWPEGSAAICCSANRCNSVDVRTDKGSLGDLRQLSADLEVRAAKRQVPNLHKVLGSARDDFLGELQSCGRTGPGFRPRNREAA